MKKNLLVLVLSMLVLNISTMAQNLREYIGTADRSEIILDTKAMSDGGAVMVGYSTKLNGGNYDYTTDDILIMRVDATGNVMWHRRFGVVGEADKLSKIIIAANGELVAVGVVRHVPWYGVSPFPGYAAIYRFNPATGATIFSNYLTDASGNENDKGSIYEDVVELDNGEIIAVGARDCRPGYSDGIVTSFTPSLVVNWNEIFNIANTDGLTAVTQQSNRIFVGGYHYSGTYYDLNITEMDVAGTIIWSNSYPYTVFHPGLGYNIDNNILTGLQIENNELMVATNVANDWVASTGSMSGIMRVDMASGAFLSLHMFNQANTYTHSNRTPVDYLNNSTAYYAINPANMLISIGVPYTNNPTFAISDAVLSIVDPTTGGISAAEQLLHTGEQSITTINLLGGDSYYAGISRNDPVQPSPTDHDIFYVKQTGAGLPQVLGTCDIQDEDLDDDNISVSPLALSFTTPFSYQIPAPNIVEYQDEMQVVMLCDEEPCNIEDITFCGSYANPLQFTFNVVTDPAGANVVWNFGDGSALVYTTAGTPVVHTYSTSGSYNVCVQQLNSAGDPCDEKCIEICVPTVSSAKGAKQPESSSTIQVNESNTTIGEVYPNPTDGTLNIPITTKLKSDNVSIRVIRMDGVVVFENKSTIASGKQVIRLEMNNLAPGNYMCEIRNGDGRSVKMFTRQ